MVDPTPPTIEQRPSRAERVSRDTEKTAGVMLGGSTAEAIAGAAAAVLAVLGLLGLLTTTMAAIATIAVGAAFMIEGGSIAARMSRMHNGARYSTVGGGMTVETLGGATGVVLGVLALIGIEPWTLMPIAAIVIGGSLRIGAGAADQIESMVHQHSPGGESLHQAVNVSSGARVLVGVGAGTLGILALVGISDPVALTLVALLALGAAEFLFGSALGARMAKVVKH